MKTTKKILSIVLAVMLLVGTVVVGVSADATMVYEKAGSKLVYTATTDKTANAEGVIEVKPGETVKVTAMIQANYYLGTTGSEIFCWTAGFFNTITVNDVETLNFVNNYTLTKKVIASTAANQLGTGYNKGTHEGFYTSRAYTTDCTSPYDASTATPGYVFTFTVPETATVGATGEFRMPETCSATVATTSRMRQIYAAVNNSATAYGSTSLGSEYPETIDLTGTILNFKVVSAEATEEPCDYAALDAALVLAANVDTSDDYTTATLTEFQAAYNAAKAVARDLTVDEEGANQKLIDDAADRLNKAITGLQKLGTCDYSELDAAIAQAKALDENDYTSTSWYSQAYLTSYLDAAEAVARDMVADEAGENQAIIDNAKDALLAAIAMLELRADFTALKAAIATAATADTANCTAASVAEFDAALAAAQELADSESSIGESRQAEVDAAAARLNAAIKGLTKLGECDYTALDAAIAAYEAKVADKDLYTNWADYEAAYNAAKAVTRDMIADEAGANQKVIDDAAAALNAVVLQYKAADYSAVEAAKADAAAVDASKYTSASVKAVNDAVAAVVEGYDITKQAEVDAMAAAIEEAVKNLVPLAACDYTALDAAIATTPEYGAEYYDEAAYAAYENALADAKAVERDMLADEAGVNQKAIDDAADALSAAFKKLVPEFIDYSPLEEAVAKYGKTPEESGAYTTETYEPYEEALFAAQDILANKDENAPASDEEIAAEIAAAAKALEDAYNGLKLAPVAAIVINVTPKQEYFKVGDTVEFDYLVSKTGITKLQIVYSGGSTSTYTRTHTAVKITNNGDGTETWTIATKIGSNEVSAVAKAKEGKVWEKNGYPFSYKTNPAPVPAEDKEVKSVTILKDGEAVETFTTKDTVVVRIVAGPDTLRIRLVTPGGSTSTYARDRAYQNEDGNWVWDITTRRTTAKTYEYAIHTAGKNNRLVDEGTDLIYTVTAPVVVVGPSTGDKADIVVSATVAKARLLVGDKQTVTVVTDKDALGVRVIDANGSVYYQTKDTALAVDNGDGTLTWTFDIGCNYAATYTFNVQALYSNQWLENGTTVTYRVVY